MTVELFKDVSHIYGDKFMIYFVWTINMVCDINGFLNIKSTFHYSWNKSYLDMVYYLLNVILDSNILDLSLLILYLVFWHQYA